MESYRRFTVEPNAFGFGIKDGGEPVTHNGGLVTFHGRMWAHLYADALEIGDTDAAAETLRSNGCIYGPALVTTKVR